MQRLVRVLPYVAGREATPTYTLKDLERRTGLKRRTLQSWGDNGVIIPDADTLHGGRGSPRFYAITELILAMLLAPCANAGLTIGHLARLANILRQGLDVHQAGAVTAMFEPGTDVIGHVLVRALHGQGENFLFIAADREGVVVISPVTDEGKAGEAGEPLAFNPLEMRGQTTRPPCFGFWIDLAVIHGLLQPTKP
jgi:hypothetical protein